MTVNKYTIIVAFPLVVFLISIFKWLASFISSSFSIKGVCSIRADKETPKDIPAMPASVSYSYREGVGVERKAKVKNEETLSDN